MTSQREELGINEYPFFTHKELDENRAQYSYRDLVKPFAVPGTDLTASFHDAGHILGSTGVMIKENGNTLVLAFRLFMPYMATNNTLAIVIVFCRI
jgi:Cft2 family RNA processing exonuclease